MVESGVKTYLEGKHNGALLISGAWGSGKSYYVKHNLSPFIKTVPYRNSDKISTTEKVLKMLESSDKFLDNRYFPIKVSVFGVSTIAELEKEITKEWLDKITKGINKKVKHFTDGLKSLLDNSKKIKEWYDFSGLLDYSPGLSAVTRNTVIILDDLERFDDKISENELLGFINRLTETLGFKVILVANEDFLIKDRQKLLTFREKVVEKTLMFYPDTNKVATEIIRKFEDDQFCNFMLSEEISASYNCSSPFLSENDDHRFQLQNLRTLIFAINHFHTFHSRFSKYCADKHVDVDLKNELLKFAWFSILALSIEYKRNRISCVDIRDLDKFFFLRAFERYSVARERLDVFNEDSKQDEQQVQDSEKQKESKDINYKNWFYKFYFTDRGVGLLPISSPQIIDFVVRGSDPDFDILIDSYLSDKNAINPQIDEAKEIDYIGSFFKKQLSMSNDEVVEFLKKMLMQVREAKVNDLTAFVNGATYLLSYLPALPDVNESEIEDAVKTGIHLWLANNELNDLELTRFKAIKSQVSQEVKWVYEEIERAINVKNGVDANALKETLLNMFDHDVRGFCNEICPHAFHPMTAIAVTHFMNNPILNEISKSKIQNLVDSSTISDADALQSVLEHRYSNHDLWREERVFWITLSKEIKSLEIPLTPGQVVMKRSLMHALTQILLR